MTGGTLDGVSVVVTRASHQSGPLVAALQASGAAVIEAPAIAIVPPLDGGQPLDDALLRLERFTWVAFSSVNAVAAALARSERRGVRRRLLQLKVAAVGRSTAARAESEFGRPVDLVSPHPSAASLAAAFPAPMPGDRCFVPMATDGRPDLVDGLVARGWDVWAVAAYRTVHPSLPDPIVEDAVLADVAVFASPSAVSGHLDQTGGRLASRVVCIGETTRQACADLGVPVTAIAETPSVAGLVAAVRRAVQG